MAHPAKSMHAKGTTPTEPRQRVQHLSRQDRRGCPILSRSVRKGGSRHHHTGIGIASDPTPAGISVRGTHPCKKRQGWGTRRLWSHRSISESDLRRVPSLNVRPSRRTVASQRQVLKPLASRGVCSFAGTYVTQSGYQLCAASCISTSV